MGHSSQLLMQEALYDSLLQKSRELGPITQSSESNLLFVRTFLFLQKNATELSHILLTCLPLDVKSPFL